MIMAILAFVTYFILLKILKIPNNDRLTNRNSSDYYIDYCDEPICLRV